VYYSTSRALALLELLQAHGQLRGDEIARRLEVDTRTVRRYVMILRDRGVPVDMKRGRYGGYMLPPGYRAPLALTRDEALALAYGLLGGGQRDERGSASDSERALKKVTHSLPSATRDLIHRIEGAITFATPVVAGATLPPTDSLEVTVKAIKERQRLHIRYRAGDGALTDRDIDPYQAVHRFGRWYLVGYCHLRSDLRVFRFDHILSVTARAEYFLPVEIDALAAVERAIAKTPWRWEFQVVAALTPDEVRHRISPTLAVTHPHESGALLHGFVDDLAPLAYALAGLDCPLEILNPSELRAAFLALAERIYAIVSLPTPTNY
jgi:predicted DNA-binding transcriptional regulator YafY